MQYKVVHDRSLKTKSVISQHGVVIFTMATPITNKKMIDILEIVKNKYSTGFLDGYNHHTKYVKQT